MKRRIFSIFFALVLVLSMSLVTAVPVAAQVSDWYVDCDVAAEGDGTSWEDAFDTIQEAITAAGDGDTITVAAGAYEEQVYITKDIILQGAPGAIIQMPDGTLDEYSVTYDIPGGTKDRVFSPVVMVEGADVTIDGFVVDGNFRVSQDAYGATPKIVGIVYGNADGTISNNEIKNCRAEDFAYYDNGNAIYLVGGEGNTVIVDNNNLHDYEWMGLVIDGLLTATVTENSITGWGVADYETGFPQNGIQVSRGATATIESNTITDNLGEQAGTAYYSAGVIFVLEAQGTISNNNISNNRVGIGFQWTDMSLVVAHYNNIYDNTLWGAIADVDAINTLDATNNWWGDASGPYLVNGVGDKISPYVDARVWLDTPYSADSTVCGESTGLKVGETYDLYIEAPDLHSWKVYLDDIGNDPLLPVYSDGANYSVDNDALVITLDADGKGIFHNIKPDYATDTGEAPYIGIQDGTNEIYWLEVTPSAGFSLSLSQETATVDVETEVTATVTDLDGEPMSGVMVKYGYDAAVVNNVLDPTEVEGSGLTNSDGQLPFSITPEFAGNYIVVAVGADVDAGGLLGEPDTEDGIVDFSGEQQSSVAVSPSATYALTVTPSTLYKSWTYGTIEVTVKDALGELVKSAVIKYSATGCGLTGIEDEGTSTDPDGKFTIAGINPTATGTITLTVNHDTGGTSATDYTGSTSITVSTAAKFNVDISPIEIAAATPSVITASFWDVSMKGPDGAANTNLLNNVKVTLSGVGVSKTKTIGDAATCSFEVTPEQAGTITATFVGTFDDDSVETKTLDISVTGYKVVDIVPDADQTVGDVSDISMTVTTKADAAVNNAQVTITAAQAAGFKKDVDDDGVLESFKTIVINGVTNEISYGGGDEEPFLVNNGFYEVTDIEFAQVGDVAVEVEAKALFPCAFTVLGETAYTLSFDPTQLTAGVDLDALDITITVTETGEPATDVDSITIHGIPQTITSSTPADGLYTINPDPISEEKTGEDALVVMAKNADATKYGSDSLEVGLPSVERTFTEKDKTIPRNVMLTEANYTVSVNVIDALGEPLDGYLWIGTYDAVIEEFTPVDGALNLAADGTGEFDISAPVKPGTLVWKVGSGDQVANAALLPTPSIAVEAPEYTLDWAFAPIVGETITFTVTDNYGNPAGDIDVTIVTPEGDPILKVTTPTGVFMYTPTEPGDYYVSVGDQGPVTVTVVVTRLASIAASPPSVPLIYVGETAELTIMATYEDEDKKPALDVTADATYASDPETVATVDAGLITAVTAGEATITVSYTEGVITEETTVLVTVSEVPVLVSIAASPPSVSLGVDGIQQLTITAIYSDLSEADVTADASYLSSDGTVATVSDAGVITAVALGDATITVTYETKTADVLVTVEVIEPLTIQLYEGANPIYYTGATMDLPAALTDISEITEIIWQRDVSTGGEWWSYLVVLDYGEITQLENGKVYIIVVSEAYTWELAQ